jgi:FKBP-type peptidyl-prolyl cis-trans isomerase 2
MIGELSLITSDRVHFRRICRIQDLVASLDGNAEVAGAALVFVFSIAAWAHVEVRRV